MNLFWVIPAAAVSALGCAGFFYRLIKREDPGNKTMQKIASYVRQGAMAYLRQQYKVVALVFAILFLLFALLSYGFRLQNPWMPVAFLTSGFCSGLAGFLGMCTATEASSRTAQAARESLDRGLCVAFRSGAVMGLLVVGLALLDYSFWFLILNRWVPNERPEVKLLLMTSTMVTFGVGVSLQALFARVGGGIFTKAADVGADIVGKIEVGIPEDDPRNPATVADNVGDNVGDVAGMGADLYESYYGSILAAASLGALAYFGRPALQINAVLAPALLAALGVFFSIGGIFSVRVADKAEGKDILNALNRGIYFSSLGFTGFSWVLLRVGLGLPSGLWMAVVTGLLGGIVIGKASEYYTSGDYRPTRHISEKAQTGPGPVVIGGLGTGMVSTVFPVMAVVVAMSLSFGWASGFDFHELNDGLYGVAIAAVGMLSTLGITLATDAYGPIADNAGGNAQMSQLPLEVRARTDALDAIGNTTAAIGKGFAIGSAALTALALIAAYIQELKMGLLRMGVEVVSCCGETVRVAEATLIHLANYFHVELLNPSVLVGLFMGSMMAFAFCGVAMNAVGRAAAKMVEEVRRQFREMEGILEGKTEPNYARCVRISTSAAQKEMLLPALSAVFVPFLTGIVLGVPGVVGLLVGALSSGFVLAIFMANSGGSWDNAKKYIEDGHFGGKGSEAHKAAVVGDTVGDPFKDTAGPSLNILIKLMTTSAIISAGVTLFFHR